MFCLAYSSNPRPQARDPHVPIMVRRRHLQPVGVQVRVTGDPVRADEWLWRPNDAALFGTGSLLYREWAQAAGLPLGEHSALQVLLPHEPLGAVFDPHHLRRVLVNLLDNAVKHSGAGSNVVAGWRTEGGEAVIEIRSSGGGFRFHISGEVVKVEYLDGETWERMLWIDVSDEPYIETPRCTTCAT